MCDETYSYELYRFDRADLRGSILLTVSPDSVTVDDSTTGTAVNEFLGQESNCHEVSVNLAGAKKMLRASGIAPGPFPTEKLALHFAEIHVGNSSAASAFSDMAAAAGVETTVWSR